MHFALITPFYAALLGLFFVAISARAMRLRGKLSIAVGDGGNSLMLRAIRAQANFVEYVPLALLLSTFTEMQPSVSRLFIHIVCISLLIGRISHAWGVSHVKENLRFRVFGMVMSIGAIVAPSVTLLLCYVRAGGFS